MSLIKNKKNKQSETDFQIFIDNYKDGTVQVSSGLRYNQREIIEQNILDKHSTFDRPYFSDGTEKVFFNVPFIMERVIYNNTNIDTKDCQIKAENLLAISYAPLLRGALRHHFTEYDYGEEINQYREELIGMGHILVKQVGEETKQVNLLNVVRPSHITDIQKSGIAERIPMTWTEILEHKEEWKEHWAEIEELHETLKKQGKNTFIVYEWWKEDYFPVGNKDKYTKGCIRLLDISQFEETETDTPDNWVGYIELERFQTPEFEKVKSKKRLKKLLKASYLSQGEDEEPIYPYEEQRLFTVKGRWLGLGIYERLRPITKAYNRNMNNKLRFDELYHKGLIVYTKAPNTGRSEKRTLTSDMINRISTGAVISLKQGEKLERLNLGTMIVDFMTTADKFFEFARQLAGVTATGTGERLPSQTPATIGVINEKVAKTTFDVVNEQQDLFLQRLFRKFKIKNIIEEITEEEAAKLVGDPKELKEMEEKFVENYLNNDIPKSVREGYIIPDSSQLPPEEYDKYKKAIQKVREEQGGMRFAEFTKEMLKDVEFGITFYITNESFDKTTLLANIQDTINSVMGNPMSELSFDKLQAEKLDLLGLSASRYKKSPEEIQQARMAAMPQNIQPGMGQQFGQDNQMNLKQ